MNDNQFWAIVWKCSAATICAVAFSIAGCTAHENYVETQVIAKAANPAAVACSFGGREQQNTPFCAEVAKH